MEISNEEFFFYEWLILGKGMEQEEFKGLSAEQLSALKQEYKAFESTHK